MGVMSYGAEGVQVHVNVVDSDRLHKMMRAVLENYMQISSISSI